MTTRLDAEEKRLYEQEGYLVRRSAFSSEELEPLRDACEQVVAELEAHSSGDHEEMGSYVFEVAARRRTSM